MQPGEGPLIQKPGAKPAWGTSPWPAQSSWLTGERSGAGASEQQLPAMAGALGGCLQVPRPPPPLLQVWFQSLQKQGSPLGIVE